MLIFTNNKLNLRKKKLMRQFGLAASSSATSTGEFSNILLRSRSIDTKVTCELVGLVELLFA